MYANVSLTHGTAFSDGAGDRKIPAFLLADTAPTRQTLVIRVLGSSSEQLQKIANTTHIKDFEKWQSHT
ncbi:hypothetical protein A4Z71_06110 [Candidatus Rhodoluna planktonica]|uniref:Uncharacterized protein n=1 Tax=Candidatus Rhodoluna planktonica TaxID=535712 RepID=A0A1D9E0E4_9MICO|nr:hypothetical protein A4Z71_06110 [Candidatus Rhodoluna planktonica]